MYIDIVLGIDIKLQSVMRLWFGKNGVVGVNGVTP